MALSNDATIGDAGQVAITIRPMIVDDMPGGTYVATDSCTAVQPGPNGANETERSRLPNTVAPGVGTLKLAAGSGAAEAVATSGNHPLIGNGNDNVFVVENGTDVLAGGAGNDLHTIDDGHDQIVEQASQDYDTASHRWTAD